MTVHADALKLLKQLTAPCDGGPTDHAWRKCKRCTAVHGVQNRFGLTMRLLKAAIEFVGNQPKSWQSIETAPKDGTLILVVEPKNQQRRLVVYHEAWAMWLSVPGRIQVRPTLWMPIP